MRSNLFEKPEDLISSDTDRGNNGEEGEQHPKRDEITKQ